MAAPTAGVGTLMSTAPVTPENVRERFIEENDRLPEWFDCVCLLACGSCSLHEVEFHVHPQTAGGVTGPCPVHPEAPGDL